MFKISVIIPVYNSEIYLRQCLDSVINQTLMELQIICVNDGSTDNSTDILKEYSLIDNRIVVINQENKGHTNARNAGLKAATGEYIHFLDSDDYISLEFYELLYMKAKIDNSDLVYCRCLKIFPEGKKQDYPFTNEGLELSMWSTSTVWFFIFKNVFNLKMNEKICKYSEDDLFSFLLFRKIKSVSSEKMAIIYYRQNENSITNADINNAIYISDKMEIIKSILEYGKQEPKILKLNKKAFEITLNMEMDTLCSRRLSVRDLILVYKIILTNIVVLVNTDIDGKCFFKKTLNSLLNGYRRKIIQIRFNKKEKLIRILGIDLLKRGGI